MAVASVIWQGTREDDADGTTAEDGRWADMSDKAAVQEVDFWYQKVSINATYGAVSEKIGFSRNGVTYVPSAVIDFVPSGSPKRVWLSKTIVTNPAVLRIKGSIGANLEIGSGGHRTNYHEYYFHGWNTYPARGGWQFEPVDPSALADASTGSASAIVASAINYFGFTASFSKTSKSENVATDCIDHVEYGKGLQIVDGSTAAPGTFDDFVAFDVSAIYNRYGVVTVLDDVIYVTGTLQIGNTSSSRDNRFSDSNRVVIFRNSDFLSEPGFFGITLNAHCASSVYALSNSIFRSVGTRLSGLGSDVDTRAVYQVVSSAADVTIDSNTFDVFRSFTLTAAASVVGCSFLSGSRVTQNRAVIEGCSFALASTADGSALVASDVPQDITNCSWTFTDGHAIEITSAVGTVTFTGNTFTGYGASATNDAAIYNNSGGFVQLDIAGGGSTPTVRNGTGASTIVNNPILFTLTGLKTDSEVAILSSTGAQLAGVEDSSTTFQWTHGGTEQEITYVVHHLDWVYVRENFTVSTVDAVIPISQRTDRVYRNP